MEKEAKREIKAKEEKAINLRDKIADNFVLKNYHNLNTEQLYSTASSLLDLYNTGSPSSIDLQVQGPLCLFL